MTHSYTRIVVSITHILHKFLIVLIHQLNKEMAWEGLPQHSILQIKLYSNSSDMNAMRLMCSLYLRSCNCHVTFIGWLPWPVMWTLSLLIGKVISSLMRPWTLEIEYPSRCILIVLWCLCLLLFHRTSNTNGSLIFWSSSLKTGIAGTSQLASYTCRCMLQRTYLPTELPLELMSRLSASEINTLGALQQLHLDGSMWWTPISRALYYNVHHT